MDEFQRLSLLSVALPKNDPSALSHRVMGVSGEAGILTNQVKKMIRDNKGKSTPEDLAVIKKRLGDVLYYAAVLAEYFDWSLSEVAKKNVDQSEAFRE